MVFLCINIALSYLTALLRVSTISVFFPGKFGQFTPEMAVIGRLAVDGPKQIQTFNNSRRPEIKYLFDNLCKFRARHHSRTVGAHHHGHRIGTTDGIGHLNFTFFRPAPPPRCFWPHSGTYRRRFDPPLTDLFRKRRRRRGSRIRRRYP